MKQWVADFNGRGTWTVFGPSKPSCFVERIAAEIKSQQNAALIAAAPELLEACKSTLDIINSYSHIPAMFTACKTLMAAIAKTTVG